MPRAEGQVQIDAIEPAGDQLTGELQNIIFQQVSIGKTMQRRQSQMATSAWKLVFDVELDAMDALTIRDRSDEYRPNKRGSHYFCLSP